MRIEATLTPAIKSNLIFILYGATPKNAMTKRSVVILFSLAMLAGVAGASQNFSGAHADMTSTKSEESDAVLVGAGDIASCDDLAGAEATAKLIDKIPGTVFVSGDLAYPDGSDENFAKCYGPTWGRFKDRTRPAPGNHEYNTDGASGYVRISAPLQVIPPRDITATNWAAGISSR